MILLVLLLALTLSMVILSLSGARPPEKAADRFTGYVVVLFLVLWFAAGRDIAPVPAWTPFLTTALFIALFAASTILTVRPPKVLAGAGERKYARHAIEAIVVDAAILIMMFLFGISVLGRFQW